jgi:hypothetical protein
MTAGLDLGDKYSHLCLIDIESGEIMEESRLRTNPEALNAWCIPIRLSSSLGGLFAVGAPVA